jgi:hypothetical protein
VPPTPPDDPVLRVLDFPAPLDGPPDDAPLRRPGQGVEAVTGGGLVALVDPSRGLHSLWAGEVRATGPLRLRSADRVLRPATGVRMDGAGWERRIGLPGGGEVLERGVLLDSAPALLVHWLVPEGEGLAVELLPADGRAPVEVRLGRTGGGTGVAILPPGGDSDAPEARLRTPHARERARREGRAADPGGGVRLWTQEGVDLLDPARTALERSPLGVDREGLPRGPFLLGVEDREPRFARGGALAELGLGGLLAGRSGLGWSALDALLQEPVAPALPTLHLAAALAAWTGRGTRLADRRSALDGLAERLPDASAGAAFPGPARVLENLAAGVEPLGGGWKDALLARKDTLLGDASAGAPAGGGGSRGLRLPVLGGPDEPPPSAPNARATLPLPSAFAPLDTPGVAPRLALHAARLVRAWVEGVLGAEADAAYGRLRLAPDLRPGAGAPPEGLSVQGIAVGGAAVALDCRIRGPACTLRLLQEGGRLPLNLVFEPRLPLRPPVTVTVDGERADIPAEAVEGGVALSFQFPLDPERRIVVEEGG